MTLLEQEWRQLTQAATVAEGPLFCREIHFLSTVDSTNEEVRRRAEQRAPHGSVYVAEQQTRGKGRLGRSWFSAPGTGLYFSLLLYPEKIHSAPSSFTLLAGLAVCRAIRALTNCPAMIKWPNDIVIGPKKNLRNFSRTLPYAIGTGFYRARHRYQCKRRRLPG